MNKRPRANGRSDPRGKNAQTDPFAPLPDADGPYELVIPEGSCSLFPGGQAHLAAVAVARLLPGCLILIRSMTGEIVAEIDHSMAINRD